jgi:F-type H+-transporting ATPase subunit epsilon
MAEGTKLEIVSPERLLLSEQVRSVTVPGTEGYFTVLGEHAPFMTTLRAGFITVVDQQGISHVYYVSGGFSDVTSEGLTILAEDAKPIAEFDRAHIEALIASGLTAQEAATTAEEESRLQHEIDTWRNLLIEAGATGGASAAH